MKTFRLPLVLAQLVFVSAAGAQQPASPPTEIFKALSGSWSCAGGFPDGRKLAADLTFTPTQGGRLLHFTHIDRAPSNYWQDATWSFDTKANRVMSLSSAGSRSNADVATALFVSTKWTPTQIVLDADSLKGPPWAANRFSYAIRGAAGMLMRWEVQRNGAWTLGDSLICSRAKPSPQ